jgi:HEAT repeat protein
VSDPSTLIAQLISGDDAQAETAAEKLARLDEKPPRELFPLLESDNPDHRWWAVRVLSSFDTELAQASLCAALEDGDPAVRYCAALGLRHSPTPKAIRRLMKKIEEGDRLLSRLAGDALAAIGKPAIPALAKALQDQNPTLRVEAARALALMEHNETIPILFRSMEDPSSMVQHWVDEGLTRLGIGMVFFKA